MKTNRYSLLWCALVLVSWAAGADAQSVTITPLGSVQGEFCVGDRALLSKIRRVCGSSRHRDAR